MFLDIIGTNIEILSVFELSWDKRTAALSDRRPYDAISIRLKGNADFIVGDKKYHASTGDITYVPAYLQYALNAATDEHIYVIHFNSPNKGKEIEVFTPKNEKLFIDLFRKAHEISTNKLPGYVFALTSTFYKILEQMCVQNNDEQFSVLKNFNYALEYLHLNYTNESLTVKQLADIAYMSETYFRKIFFQNLNTTPLKYICELRLSLADELLASKYYNISEISQMCGFSDPKYFSTVYKKMRGIPPSVVCK